MEPAATDSQLVHQARKGDPQAFTTLVERHFGMVYAVAYAQMGHRETAEDLAQEVFLRAYLYLASLENPARFPQWLVRIAHNLAKDWHRRDARSLRLVAMVPIDDAEMEAAMAEESRAGEATASEENVAWLNEAILKLPGEQREAVLLHYTEGLSQKEIADRLAVHPSTIGRHLKHALKALQHSLEPILRTSAPSLKPRKSTVARTVAILGAAAAMSAQSKLALAVAGGGAAWIASVSVPAASTAGPIAGFLKTISTVLFSGGKIMVISKLVAVAVVGVSLVVGGSHLLQQRSAGVQAADTTATLPQGKTLVEVTAVTQDEKDLLEQFHKIQKDFADKDYTRFGTYGTNSVLSWKDHAKVKEYVENKLNDNVIDEVDYMAKGTATAFDHAMFGSGMALILTEPWHGTTAHLSFSKMSGQWTVTDINEIKGFGREITETSIVAPTPANTSAMTNEEIVRNFYQALIEKKFDLAVSYMQFPDEKTSKQFINLLAGLLPICPIKEIREIKANGDKATVRIGVQQGFPGGGIKNLRAKDERTAKIDMVEGASGKKISYTSGFLGDQPGNYE